MSDAKRIKELLRDRVAEMAAYLFPNGKREGNHWRIGDVTGTPGHSFDICIVGDKAGLWGDFADSGKHSRSLLDLWMAARNCDFKTALREAAEWTGYSLHGSNGATDTRQRGGSPAPPLSWRACVEALTGEHIARLAE
jgi:twinkle protein